VTQAGSTSAPPAPPPRAANNYAIRLLINSSKTPAQQTCHTLQRQFWITGEQTSGHGGSFSSRPPKRNTKNEQQLTESNAIVVLLEPIFVLTLMVI
jgi:hypothetical protein